MASLNLTAAKAFHKHAFDGLLYAKTAVEFAALGLEAEKQKFGKSRLHLYALAIELGFKSLALRSGSTPEECKTASHSVRRQIKLVEKFGVTVPDSIQTRLADDKWFMKLLMMTRYPKLLREPATFENTLFFHSNYPEMIAEILELPCDAPLSFEGGNALTEIRNKLQKTAR